MLQTNDAHAYTHQHVDVCTLSCVQLRDLYWLWLNCEVCAFAIAPVAEWQNPSNQGTSDGENTPGGAAHLQILGEKGSTYP